MSPNLQGYRNAHRGNWLGKLRSGPKRTEWILQRDGMVRDAMVW